MQLQVYTTTCATNDESNQLLVEYVVASFSMWQPQKKW
jgi:hypothetical protein